MKQIRKSRGARLLLLAAALMFALPLSALASKAPKATTTIHHKPIKYFISGKRIRIVAEVDDKNGLETVRCYFKAATQADFVFVTMAALGGKSFEAILPAPDASATTLEYLILAVNKQLHVVRTEPFTVNKDDQKDAGAWQQVSAQGDIQVSTELAQAPQTISGFSDSIVIDVVESSARFGAVAGLYGLAAETAATGGAAGAGGTTSAVSVGVVSASDGGSGMAVVGTVVAVALIAGGAAVALGGGGGDDGGGSPNPTPPPPTTDVTSREVTICVEDPNVAQDDYYNLYVNNQFVGEIQIPPGGEVCYPTTFNGGSNLVELRLFETQGSGTFLTLTIDPGGYTQTFSGSTSHSWTVTAP